MVRGVAVDFGGHEREGRWTAPPCLPTQQYQLQPFLQMFGATSQALQQGRATAAVLIPIPMAKAHNIRLRRSFFIADFLLS